MKNIVSILFIVLLISSCKESKLKSQDEFNGPTKSVTTTYYFIRHAEKNRSNTSNENPDLTEAGKERAKKWAELFKDIDFDAVYTTNFIRTRKTALPTANKNNLDLLFYNPLAFDYQTFLDATKGQTILIVGHSDSTPKMVNTIINEQKYNSIDDAVFNNYFIVTIDNNGISSQQLVMP